MNKLHATLMVLSVAGITAFAEPLNITVSDKEGSGTGWYGIENEDEEVTTGCVATQPWDLEAFILDGTTLSLVGGYDFINGKDNYLSGDIFIDVTNDAKYGSELSGSSAANGYFEVANANGWDYVIDLDVKNGKYDIYSLSTESIVKTAFYAQNACSNPWTFVGNEIDKLNKDALAFSYSTINGSTVDTYSFTGSSHNKLSVDLSFLGNTDFTAHYTMQCGNDNIIGKGTVNVPEPASISLLGIGFLFLGLFSRKRKV